MSSFEIHPMPLALDSALMMRLAEVEVSTVGHWRRWGFPNRAIERVTSGPTVVGTAVTVASPGDDNSIVHHAVSLLRPGDILIIDRLGENELACWGGVVNHAAKVRHAAGVIIDGPCTDIQEIRASGFPVWCRGVSGRTAFGRGYAGRLNVPVSIGGAVVMPGDAILCDDDGILVLPPSDVISEIDKALTHQMRAAGIFAELNSGKTLTEMSGARDKIFSRSSVG